MTITNIYSLLEPFQPVDMMNSMYSKFRRFGNVHWAYKVNVSIIVFFGGWHFCVCIFFVWVWFMMSFLLSNPTEPHVITGSETGWKCGVYRVSAELQTSVLVNILSVLSILWDKTLEISWMSLSLIYVKKYQPCHWEIFEVILIKIVCPC